MSGIKFQLVAVNDENKKVQILNEDSDMNYLESIADARDGMMWVGSDLCDLKVVRA